METRQSTSALAAYTMELQKRTIPGERHRTYIGSAENGARNLTIQVLTMFARGLGLTVSELLVGLEDRAKALSKSTRRNP